MVAVSATVHPSRGGYYYDMFLEEEQVTPSDFGNLETLFKSIVKEKQPFVRLEMKKEDLLEMFKVSVYMYNPLSYMNMYM